jgi:hypothetical protein
MRRITGPAASSRWLRSRGRCRATSSSCCWTSLSRVWRPPVVLELFTVFDKLRSHASIVIVEGAQYSTREPPDRCWPIWTTAGESFGCDETSVSARLRATDSLVRESNASHPGASATLPIACPLVRIRVDGRRTTETGAERVVVAEFTQRPATSSAISGWPPPQRARRCRRRSCRKPRRP